MKIAVVGCEASGKTVFMSALSDYFSGVEGKPCLVPENPAANNFQRFQFRQMRKLRQWPPATDPERTLALDWSLRHNGRKMLDIGMLEFGGETFRAAFRQAGDSVLRESSVRQLVDHLASADCVVLLISLKEIFRDIGEQSLDDFNRDTESLWVSRGLLEFLHEKLPKTGVVIALTQADRFRNELAEAGSAEKVLAERWPTIAAVATGIPVVALASVSRTDEAGNPAEGYKTDGILPVIHEIARRLYGAPEKIAAELPALEKSKSADAAAEYAAKLDQLRAASILLEQDFTDAITAAEATLARLETQTKAKASAKPKLGLGLKGRAHSSAPAADKAEGDGTAAEADGKPADETAAAKPKLKKPEKKAAPEKRGPSVLLILLLLLVTAGAAAYYFDLLPEEYFGFLKISAKPPASQIPKESGEAKVMKPKPAATPNESASKPVEAAKPAASNAISGPLAAARAAVAASDAATAAAEATLTPTPPPTPITNPPPTPPAPAVEKRGESAAAVKSSSPEIAPPPAVSKTSAAVGEAAAFRVWHDHKGQPIEAKWLETTEDGKRVILETKSGKRIRAVLRKLSEADREYVRQTLGAAPEAR